MIVEENRLQRGGYQRPAETLAERQERECHALLGLLEKTGAVTADRHYEPGESICEEYEPAGALYIVTAGAVELTRTHSGGKEAVLRLLGPWDFFGELALEGGMTRQAGAQALTACVVRKVPKVFVERAVKEKPEVALKLATLMGLELACHREWAACLLPRKAEVRLANLLPLLARKFGAQTDQKPTIHLRLTHGELARMVASTRESVTKALANLREQGILMGKEEHIVILDPEELAEIAVRRSYEAKNGSRVPRIGPGRS